MKNSKSSQKFESNKLGWRFPLESILVSQLVIREAGAMLLCVIILQLNIKLNRIPSATIFISFPYIKYKKIALKL